MKKNKKVFVDMDGTIARFYENRNCIQDFTKEKDFFESLKPYENMVDAVKNLYEKYEKYEIIILSSVPEESATDAICSKEKWLHRVFKEKVPEAVYVIRENKSDYVKRRFGSLEDCWLIDDFSVNLRKFTEMGGKAIKVLNEVNGRGWNGVNWQGPCVNCDDSPATIEKQLIEIIN